MSFIDKNKPVLITGGSGYIASWIIKYLLDEGYTIRASVRNPDNQEKMSHLYSLIENYPGKLSLFKADLLDEDAFADSMKDCELVIHTASPFKIQGIKNPNEELVIPAIKGTEHVLKAAGKSPQVKRIVLTSSVVAIFNDAQDIKNTKNNLFDESNWNTSASLTNQPYNYSKTLAEKKAWEIAGKQKQWDLVVINPGFVMGPSLSKRVDSTSIDFMRSLINGSFKTGVPSLYFGLVDVRDVARAHIIAGTKEEAKGRHILVADSLSFMNIANMIGTQFPDKYKLPKSELPKILMYIFGPMQGFSWKYVKLNIGIPFNIDNSYSIKDLGIKYTDIETTLKDHVIQIEEDHLI